MKYQSFIFESYAYDASTSTLKFNYSFDNVLHLQETYIFNLPKKVIYDEAMLDRAMQQLFFIAGVSYYKAFPVDAIQINQGAVDSKLAEFLSNTYQHGLREYFYHNNLPITTPVQFPSTTATEIHPIYTELSPSMLIAIGGGKDSLVSYEIAQGADLPIYTWSLGHTDQLTPLVQLLDPNQHISVERILDQKLVDGTLKSNGALNGHIPISAIFAATSTIICILLGIQDSVMSNEYSASEPTLYVGEEPVNHQYSKSLQYEQSYQEILKHLFGNSLRYYSLLRPIHEAYVAAVFSKHYYKKYKSVFSSCNRAYVQDSHKMFWCGTCPKCAFTYLALIAFLPQSDIAPLWSGRDVLRSTEMIPIYQKLLGIDPSGKPFECVGEIKECRALMDIAKQQYPELSDIYIYDSPTNFDYAKLMPHSIPIDIFDKVYRQPIFQ